MGARTVIQFVDLLVPLLGFIFAGGWGQGRLATSLFEI